MVVAVVKFTAAPRLLFVIVPAVPPTALLEVNAPTRLIEAIQVEASSIDGERRQGRRRRRGNNEQRVVAAIQDELAVIDRRLAIVELLRVQDQCPVARLDEALRAGQVAGERKRGAGARRPDEVLVGRRGQGADIDPRVAREREQAAGIQGLGDQLAIRAVEPKGGAIAETNTTAAFEADAVRGLVRHQTRSGMERGSWSCYPSCRWSAERFPFHPPPRRACCPSRNPRSRR